MERFLSVRVLIAILLTLTIPVGGITFGVFATSGALRCFFTCLFPLVLIVDPPFFRTVFPARGVAVAFGWIGYAAIALQVFFLPPLLRALLKGV